VVIKGSARRLDSDAEIHESGVDKLVSASPTAKQDFIRITPDSVTGRRFRKDTVPARDVPTASTTTGSHQPVRPPENDERGPIPIPHFPPRPNH
jgi:hypothetical protein